MTREECLLTILELEAQHKETMQKIKENTPPFEDKLHDDLFKLWDKNKTIDGHVIATGWEKDLAIPKTVNIWQSPFGNIVFSFCEDVARDQFKIVPA